MNKFLLGAALATATVLAAPASAAVIALSVPGTGGSTGFTQSSNTSGAIADEFQFTVPVAGDASGSLISIDLSGAFDVVITKVWLDAIPFHQDLTGSEEKWTLASANIGAGTHSIFVEGTWGTNGGSYSGTLNFLPAAVPEPAAWALMIAGFGLVGGAMRGRRRVTSVTYA
ncbi:FxDxF family PEP-CTERM protein [Sphingomonas flavalba]|uniref:FxDxF family PEP-CTERM protein n=1 Tax=Sphingomonas flavalba TaxID=2559804 RepID=UPI0039E18792